MRNLANAGHHVSLEWTSLQKTARLSVSFHSHDTLRYLSIQLRACRLNRPSPFFPAPVPSHRQAVSRHKAGTSQTRPGPDVLEPYGASWFRLGLTVDSFRIAVTLCDFLLSLQLCVDLGGPVSEILSAMEFVDVGRTPSR
jgi:hypothetical protein